MSNHIIAGNEITIEEMPNGCFINYRNETEVRISSPLDAELLIKSLMKMLSIQYSGTYELVRDSIISEDFLCV